MDSIAEQNKLATEFACVMEPFLLPALNRDDEAAKTYLRVKLQRTMRGVGFGILAMRCVFCSPFRCWPLQAFYGLRWQPRGMSGGHESESGMLVKYIGMV